MIEKYFNMESRAPECLQSTYQRRSGSRASHGRSQRHCGLSDGFQLLRTSLLNSSNFGRCLVLAICAGQRMAEDRDPRIL
jgi:hypothetical protein